MLLKLNYFSLHFKKCGYYKFLNYICGYICGSHCISFGAHSSLSSGLLFLIYPFTLDNDEHGISQITRFILTGVIEKGKMRNR